MIPKVTVLSASHAIQLVFLAQSNHFKEKEYHGGFKCREKMRKSEPVADASNQAVYIFQSLPLRIDVKTHNELDL